VPLLSAVTTCKGRLEHLKLSLPTLMALPDCEVVVVDYDCPDRSGDWVRATYPAAKVVRAEQRPLFNLAKARNLGVAAATSPWLLLTDADVLVAPEFSEAVQPLLQPGVYLRPEAAAVELSGTMIVAHGDLAEIGGYDEVFEGWGSEDLDVMMRLDLTGRRAGSFPGRLVTGMPHDDALRGRFHDVADPRANSLTNALYRHVKMDLWRLGVQPDEAARRAIYTQLRPGARSPDGLKSAEVAFRDRTLAGRRVTTSLRYRLI